jgi:hypothetical protein
LCTIDGSAAVVTEDGGSGLLPADSVEVDGIDVHGHDGRSCEVFADEWRVGYMFGSVFRLGILVG